MKNNSEIAVKVEGLRRTFGDFVAVNDISFQVRKGEIFGFLGPNGAGKSTTIKMLCGLLKPTAGRGFVGEHDIMTEFEEIKKNIGYMSQKFSLYDDLTVEENIDFFSGIYRVSKNRKRERKEWAIGMAGLKDKRGALTRTLPGGFKQRLALGCAVLHEPPVIFLDEPTSGVDPISRRNFWELIYSLSDSGTTVFVTTHYMEEAEYCDMLALIYRGAIIAGGMPNEMKQQHMKKEIIEIEADNILNVLGILEKNNIDAAIFGSLIHATVVNAELAIPDIKRLIEESGNAVRNIEVIMPSLEDVFVALIEEA